MTMASPSTLRATSTHMTQVAPRFAKELSVAMMFMFVS